MISKVPSRKIRLVMLPIFLILAILGGYGLIWADEKLGSLQMFILVSGIIAATGILEVFATWWENRHKTSATAEGSAARAPGSLAGAGTWAGPPILADDPLGKPAQQPDGKSGRPDPAVARNHTGPPPGAPTVGESATTAGATRHRT